MLVEEIEAVDNTATMDMEQKIEIAAGAIRRTMLDIIESRAGRLCDELGLERTQENLDEIRVALLMEMTTENPDDRVL